MKPQDKFLLAVTACVAFCLIVFAVILDMRITNQARQINTEIQALKEEMAARGDLIARLQAEAEYANEKASWILNKIDKRRVLIPVMGGRAYQLVEIEQDIEEIEGAK